MSDLRVNTLRTANGVEVYTAKAWVNFNGTGTVAIRASGNVSSITDNGVGDYTVNFTNTLTDGNYSINGLVNGTSGSGFGMLSIFDASTAGTGTNPTASSCRLRAITGSSVTDVSYVCVSIFR